MLPNAQRIFTEYELFYLKIHDCFDGILISSSCGVKKPDERFFRILLERYQIKPGEPLMIGNDLTTDIKGTNRQVWMLIIFILQSHRRAMKK